MDADAKDETRASAPWGAEALAWAALAAIVALAWALRAPLLDLGYTSDEVGTLTSLRSFRAILDHPETGVNPPLWRAMFNLPFEAWDTPWWGRRFAFGCSIGAVVAAFVVGRRAAGGVALAGLLAAAFVATDPWLVRYAALFRIYGWWSLTVLVHLGVMGRTLEVEGRARWAWGAAAVVTAMLLPWIHYASVPLLLAFGLTILLGIPGRRAWILAYVPAAIGVLPLVPYVLYEEGNRVSPDTEPFQQIMVRLASLDLHPPAWLWNHVIKPTAGALGLGTPLAESMAASVAVLLLLGAVLWRSLPTTARLAWGGFVGLYLGIGAMAQAQYVRPNTVLFFVTLAAPLFPALVARVPRRGLRIVALLALGVWFGATLPKVLAKQRRVWDAEAAGPTFAATWHGYDQVRGERPVIIHPRHRTWTTYFHLAHDHPRTSRGGTVCAGRDPCFQWDDTAFVGMDDLGDGAAVDGLVLHLDAWRPEGFLSTCTPLHDSGTWGVWDCRGGAGDADDPPQGEGDRL